MASDGSKNTGISSWLLLLMGRLVSILSFQGAGTVGALLGWLWYRVVPIRRRVVLDNLEIAFPGQRALHRQAALSCYTLMGRNTLELLRMGTMDSAAVCGAVTVSGWEHYEAARARGKGVIVVTGHFGNFDLLAASQAAAGVPLAIVSRDLATAGANDIWMTIRRRQGVTVFREGESRAVLAWLKAGRVLGLVLDQRTGEEKGGMRVPFFGRDVWTSSAAARLAIHTGAALLPVHTWRDAEKGHCMVIEPALDIEPAADCFDILVDLNRTLEKWVRLRPGNWMWLHRRFKGSVESSQTSLE